MENKTVYIKSLMDKNGLSLSSRSLKDKESYTYLGLVKFDGLLSIFEMMGYKSYSIKAFKELVKSIFHNYQYVWVYSSLSRCRFKIEMQIDVPEDIMLFINAGDIDIIFIEPKKEYENPNREFKGFVKFDNEGIKKIMIENDMPENFIGDVYESIQEIFKYYSYINICFQKKSIYYTVEM